MEGGQGGTDILYGGVIPSVEGTVGEDYLCVGVSCDEFGSESHAGNL